MVGHCDSCAVPFKNVPLRKVHSSEAVELAPEPKHTPVPAKLQKPHGWATSLTHVVQFCECVAVHGFGAGHDAPLTMRVLWKPHNMPLVDNSRTQAPPPLK